MCGANIMILKFIWKIKEKKNETNGISPAGYLNLGMAASAVKAQILLTASATPIEEYAAVELQRYYYQLSGRLLSIDHEEVPDRKTEFVLTRLDHPLVKSWRDKGVLPLKSMPGEQGYVIRQ